MISGNAVDLGGGAAEAFACLLSDDAALGG